MDKKIKFNHSNNSLQKACNLQSEKIIDVGETWLKKMTQTTMKPSQVVEWLETQAKKDPSFMRTITYCAHRLFESMADEFYENMKDQREIHKINNTVGFELVNDPEKWTPPDGVDADDILAIDLRKFPSEEDARSFIESIKEGHFGIDKESIYANMKKMGLA